jgi:hypothetical protein
MTLTSRLGVFCVVIGIALMGLYLASDAARQTMCSLLIWGMLLTAIGIGMWRKGTPPKEPSQRFGTLKRIMTSNKKKKANKAKKP